MDNPRPASAHPAPAGSAADPASPGGAPADRPDAGPGGSGPGGPPDLSRQAAELVRQVSEEPIPPRPRRIAAATSRIARRSGGATWHGVRSGIRWLTAEVLAMAPRLPVRDQRTLRAQFPGLGPDELADQLIRGASRAAAAVGAGAGVAMVLPLPTAPVEIAVETLALVGIEIKLVAELHEVYSMRAPGTAPQRMMGYVGAWANRRGVAFVPGGLALAVVSPLRKRLQRRLIARTGRSAISLGPLLTGATAGAVLNRRETRHLGADVREDLRRRSTYLTHWPA